MLVFPTLRINDKHKFIPLLKRFLNELVEPSPNLLLNDVVDDKTIKAVRLFKIQWMPRILTHQYDTHNYNEITAGLWGMIGRALSKDKLIQELKNAPDPEVRSLLLGMDYINSIHKFYTVEIEKCDAKIALIFGGKNAVAAANGFEPDSLAVFSQPKVGGTYPYYRGDEIDASRNNVVQPGHLSTSSMHLYGSSDGTRFGVDGNTYTELYVPDGFRESKKNIKFSRNPGPQQASLDFYYEKLGNYQNVTLMVSHIKDFKVEKVGDRWSIGKIGGKAGNTAGYVHSHLDLFEGDVGMTGKRIRIPFAKAFC